MSRSLHEASMPKKHELWMARFGCVYKDSEEKEMRFKIFQTNVEFIESFNGTGSRSYKLSVKEFADQTNEEFIASRNGYKRSSPRKSLATSSFRYQNVTTVPSSIDWRKKGAVTALKDQGNVDAGLGSFSPAYGNGMAITPPSSLMIGVNLLGSFTRGLGGPQSMRTATQTRNQANYPYKGIDGTCSTKKAAAKINGYEDVPANSEKALLEAVANQPVSVAIDASGSDFQFYSSGVFTGECGTSLDHGVTAVGYGTSADGTKYWLVKNSWGTEWGVDV
ncbi:hypothetical protein HHK36_001391 [Tetracentron sinense]|uniref:Uncharacterized protein n=1 Tax=Tetracentron sinense TaxID=13715 RepID=A0A834ZTB4_TETSI|nr:hypothetical protein HHK36_001391 [Tetracentron sinense]